jgi:hypothetical protein
VSTAATSAFAAPIPPGKTTAVCAFIVETLGPRRADFNDLQRRSGVTEESYWLQVDPEGNDTLVIVSRGNQVDFWGIMTNPQTDFDRWYREQIETIWEFDASVPCPSGNGLLATWPPPR